MKAKLYFYLTLLITIGFTVQTDKVYNFNESTKIDLSATCTNTTDFINSGDGTCSTSCSGFFSTYTSLGTIKRVCFENKKIFDYFHIFDKTGLINKLKVDDFKTTGFEEICPSGQVRAKEENGGCIASCAGGDFTIHTYDKGSLCAASDADLTGYKKVTSIVDGSSYYVPSINNGAYDYVDGTNGVALVSTRGTASGDYKAYPHNQSIRLGDTTCTPGTAFGNICRNDGECVGEFDLNNGICVDINTTQAGKHYDVLAKDYVAQDGANYVVNDLYKVDSLFCSSKDTSSKTFGAKDADKTCEECTEFTLLSNGAEQTCIDAARTRASLMISEGKYVHQSPSFDGSIAQFFGKHYCLDGSDEAKEIKQAIAQTPTGLSYVSEVKMQGETLCNYSGSTPNSIPLKNHTGINVLKDTCTKSNGYLTLSESGSEFCILRGDCNQIMFSETKDICLSATSSIDCIGASGKVYGGKCFDACPQGTIDNNSTCIEVATASSAYTLDSTTYSLTENSTPGTANNEILTGTTNIVVASADFKANTELISFLNGTTNTAIWPDECPRTHTTNHYYVDTTSKSCKSTLNCGDTNCIKREGNHFVCVTGTANDDSNLCAGEPDDSAFDDYGSDQILSRACRFQDKRYRTPGDKCIKFADIDEDDPCEDSGYTLKVTFDSSTGALTNAFCENTTTCAGDYWKIRGICSSDNSTTDTDFKPIFDKYPRVGIQERAVPANKTSFLAPLVMVKDCNNATDAFATATFLGKNVCFDYQSCINYDRIVVYSKTNDYFTCEDPNASYIPFIRSDFVRNRVFIVKAGCEIESTYRVVKNIWNNDEELCVMGNADLVELLTNNSLDTADSNHTLAFGGFTNKLTSQFNKKVTSNGTFFIDSTTGLKKIYSTGLYHDACTAGTFEESGICYLPSECFKIGKYNKEQSCLEFSALNISSLETSKEIDFNDGLQKTSPITPGDNLIFKKGGERLGVISKANCNRNDYFIDYTDCVDACPGDKYTYDVGKEKLCLTKDDCVKNITGQSNNQHFFHEANKLCLTQAQCTGKTDHLIDFFVNECTTSCNGKVKDTTNKECVQMCEYKNPIEYQLLQAGSEGTCGTVCQATELFSKYHRVCADTNCPAGTYKAFNTADPPVETNECKTSIECRATSESYAVSLASGKCNAFTKGADKFLSTDFIWGTVEDCKTGKLFNGVHTKGVPYYEYQPAVDSEGGHELHCLRYEDTVASGCPSGSYPYNVGGALDSCFTELAAAPSNKILNNAYNEIVDSCNTTTDVITKLGIFNRCVLFANFKSHINNKYKVRYLVYKAEGKDNATMECGTGDAATQFDSNGDIRCISQADCDNDENRLFWDVPSSDKDRCLSVAECSFDKIKLIEADGTVRCIEKNRCVTEGGDLLYETDEIKCTKQTCSLEHNAVDKCFTKKTCNDQGELVFLNESTFECITSSSCESAGRVSGVDKDGVKRCFTLDQCIESEQFVNNESRTCMTDQQCQGICGNELDCIHNFKNGFCYKKHTKTFTSDPRLMFEKNHPVSSNHCGGDLKSNFDSKECQSECKLFTNSTGNVCYDNCKYSILPANGNLVRPFECSGWDTRPGNYFYAEVRDFDNKNLDTVILSKTVPTGYIAQYSRLTKCTTFLVKHICQPDGATTCPQYTFPVNVNERLSYCRACNDQQNLIHFPVKGENDIRTNTCVNQIEETAILVNTALNAYEPCLSVTGTVIIDGKCTKTCPDANQEVVNHQCVNKTTDTTNTDTTNTDTTNTDTTNTDTTNTDTTNTDTTNTDTTNTGNRRLLMATDNCSGKRIFSEGEFRNKLACPLHQAQRGDQCVSCGEVSGMFMEDGKCVSRCSLGNCSNGKSCIRCEDLENDRFIFDSKHNIFNKTKEIELSVCPSGKTGKSCILSSLQGNQKALSRLEHVYASIMSFNSTDKCKSVAADSQFLSMMTSLEEITWLLSNDRTDLYNTCISLFNNAQNIILKQFDSIGLAKFPASDLMKVYQLLNQFDLTALKLNNKAVLVNYPQDLNLLPILTEAVSRNIDDFLSASMDIKLVDLTQTPSIGSINIDNCISTYAKHNNPKVIITSLKESNSNGIKAVEWRVIADGKDVTEECKELVDVKLQSDFVLENKEQIRRRLASGINILNPSEEYFQRCGTGEADFSARRSEYMNKSLECSSNCQSTKLSSEMEVICSCPAGQRVYTKIVEKPLADLDYDLHCGKSTNSYAILLTGAIILLFVLSAVFYLRTTKVHPI